MTVCRRICHLRRRRPCLTKGTIMNMTLKMTLFSLMMWTLFAVMIFLTGCVSGAHAAKLTLYNDATKDVFVEFGEPGAAGDLILWNSNLETESGEEVGMCSGKCTRLDAAGNYYCSYVIDHHDVGILSVTGVQAVEPDPSHLVIIGGTGAYEGATGHITATPNEDRSKFRNDIEYHIPQN